MRKESRRAKIRSLRKSARKTLVRSQPRGGIRN